MDPEEAWRSELAGIRKAGLHRFLRACGASGPRTTVGGRDVALLCGNDYLGLSRHPRVVAAAQRAAEQWGVGAGASRLISGSMAPHAELERELADWKQAERTLSFGSGMLANLGAIPALAGPGDLVVSDQLNHASIVDGCRLSRADVHVYPHGDPAAAAQLLRAHRASHRRAIVVTDGVFSMDGDLAPLPELAEACATHDAALYVDDAHGTGVLGPEGRGSIHATGVKANGALGAGLVQMGTLSKALGCEGGFVAGSATLRELLVNRSRSSIFSTAMSPAVAAAGAEAVRVARDADALRARLAANARHLRKGLEELGLAVPGTGPGQHVTPIIPILVGKPEPTMALMDGLLERGVFAAAIRPPTVPPGSCRIRVTVRADHTAADLDLALAGIAGAVNSI